MGPRRRLAKGRGPEQRPDPGAGPWRSGAVARPTRDAVPAIGGHVARQGRHAAPGGPHGRRARRRRAARERGPAARGRCRVPEAVSPGTGSGRLAVVGGRGRAGHRDGPHARGARVTAHASELDGARAGVLGGVDSIEHGDELDADLVAEMARRGTFLVSTIAVFDSWLTFHRTTTIPRFAAPEASRRLEARRERARESVRLARSAGVKIAAGTDFGGGSLRANQLAWVVEGLVAAGLEPWEALAAATWRGGELLGEPGAGAVQEGGPADFFLIHGDPLSDPAALWRVWRVAWLD
ncbi:MAG TPA: amidohydrolase family protein [Candidatus Limnocylindrales bacterium]|nr:amidohydrolase family protein [Candidatus Limnocylindrales bacterium]